jgi:hypothetical protein
MKTKHKTTYVKLLGSVALGFSAAAAMAGSVTYDFTTDPTQGATPIQVYQTGFADSTGSSIYYKSSAAILGASWA